MNQNMSVRTGFFLSIEGPDGAGKTTAVAGVKARLEALGVEVLAVREPGGCPLGDQIRVIFKDPANVGMVPMAELGLIMACRSQLVATVIRPALARGAIVIADRFTDSTMAYQGAGRGLDPAMLRDLNDQVTGGLYPDRTFVLDIGAATSEARGQLGPKCRFDMEDREFRRRVSLHFMNLLGPRYRYIDAETLGPDAVQDSILLDLIRTNALAPLNEAPRQYPTTETGITCPQPQMQAINIPPGTVVCAQPLK